MVPPMDETERDQAQCDAQLQREYELYLTRLTSEQVAPPILTQKQRRLDHDTTVRQFTAAAEDSFKDERQGFAVHKRHLVSGKRLTLDYKARQETSEKREERARKRLSLLATSSDADLTSEASSHTRSQDGPTKIDVADIEALSKSPLILHRQMVTQSVGCDRKPEMKRKKKIRRRNEEE